MSRYHFSDLPKPLPASAYSDAVRQAVERLVQVKGLLAVYSIGSVGSPGISDIDLVAVFEDGTVWKEDLRKGLAPTHRQLFVHAPYATSRSLLIEGQRYTFFRPYTLIYGTDLLFGSNFPEPDGVVRDQVALEYLFRFLLSITMQRAYRQLRVRSLLLNAKGAAIDLEHLSGGDMAVTRFTDRLLSLRQQWFAGKNPPLKEFVEWFDGFSDWFPEFLSNQLSGRVFYLPEGRTYSLARNLSIGPGSALQIVSQVRRVSFLRPLAGRRYFNLLNRINHFRLSVPSVHTGFPDAIARYFDYNARHRAFQQIHLPGCLPLTNSFHLR